MIRYGDPAASHIPLTSPPGMTSAIQMSVPAIRIVSDKHATRIDDPAVREYDRIDQLATANSFAGPAVGATEITDSIPLYSLDAGQAAKSGAVAKKKTPLP